MFLPFYHPWFLPTDPPTPRAAIGSSRRQLCSLERTTKIIYRHSLGGNKKSSRHCSLIYNHSHQSLPEIGPQATTIIPLWESLVSFLVLCLAPPDWKEKQGCWVCGQAASQSSGWSSCASLVCIWYYKRAKCRQKATEQRLTGILWSFLPLCEEATWARYWMTFFVFSVFPAPDSPLKEISTSATLKHVFQNYNR